MRLDHARAMIHGEADVRNRLYGREGVGNGRREATKTLSLGTPPGG
jgi:hypothetical protein